MKKMIRLPILFSFFVITFLGYSQDFRYYKGIRIFEDKNIFYYGDSSMRVNRVASVRAVETTNKKGKEKITSTILTCYDTLGRVISFVYIDRKKRYNNAAYYEYDSKNRKTQVTNLYGKRSYTTQFEYGIYKEPVKIRSFNTFHNVTKLESNVVNEFNSDSNKISSITNNGKGIIEAKVLYKYDAEKKMGTAKMYDKKGKLKHSWNFDCNKNGEIDKKGISEKICKSKEQLANGHTREITIDESRNNINRKIVEYDNKGKYSMTEEYTGKSGTILRHKTETITRGDSSFVSVSYYNTHARHPYLSFKNEFVYVNRKMITEKYESYYKKDKPDARSNSVFIYNKAGLKERKTETDEIRKSTRITIYTYASH